MAHDVFIAYASEDKVTADAVCAGLEARRIRCWIAPRDVLAGREYSEAIMDAIQESRVLVLVFSGHANGSVHVRREVERAVNGEIPILPFRIQDVEMSKQLRYFVGAHHWLDAFTPPLARHIDSLCQSVAALLAVDSGSTPARGPGAVSEQGSARQFQLVASQSKTGLRRWLRVRVVVGVLVLVALAMTAWLFWEQGEQGREAYRLGKPAEFSEQTTGMRFVLIPGGTFLMGSDDVDAAGRAYETPRHKVTISPFYLGVFEVTNEQYRKKVPGHRDRFEGDFKPVTGVSHEEAVAYVNWLSEQGPIHGYRLPSEAQWEYACRAGGDDRFTPGGSISDWVFRVLKETDRVYYYAVFNQGEGGETKQVGSKRPSRWGLFDMHGNAREWCSDWFGPYTEQPHEDPEGPWWGTMRVLRGGSCYSDAWHIRSTWRPDPRELDWYTTAGFRVALPASAL